MVVGETFLESRIGRGIEVEFVRLELAPFGLDVEFEGLELELEKGSLTSDAGTNV